MDSGILPLLVMWLPLLVVGAIGFAVVYVAAKRKQPHVADAEPRSTIGIQESSAAALTYAFGILSGLIFLLIERKSEFVRFHALQSLITFGLLSAGQFVIAFIPGLSMLAAMIWIFGLFLWLRLMVRAQKHEWYVLPVVGDIMARLFPPRD